MKHSVKLVGDLDYLVADRLLFLRQYRKMSREALGNEVGVSFQQIAKYENAQNRMSIGRLAAIARVLNIDIRYFIDDNPGKFLKDAPLVQLSPQALRLAKLYDSIPTEQQKESIMAAARTLSCLVDESQRRFKTGVETLNS